MSVIQHISEWYFCMNADSIIILRISYFWSYIAGRILLIIGLGENFLNTVRRTQVEVWQEGFILNISKVQHEIVGVIVLPSLYLIRFSMWWILNELEEVDFILEFAIPECCNIHNINIGAWRWLYNKSKHVAHIVHKYNKYRCVRRWITWYYYGRSCFPNLCSVVSALGYTVGVFVGVFRCAH
jgi:hypothetical protein